MISYLEKFNNLPQELRAKVSSPEAMKVVNDLEKKYVISLASVIMRVMVKDILIKDLIDYLKREEGFDEKRAQSLFQELQEEIFSKVAGHLGLPVSTNVPPKSFTENQKKDKADKDNLNKWMQGRKEETSAQNSGFFFSPEDEEEVRKLAQKVAGFTSKKKLAESEKQGLDEVLKNADVSFSSEDLKRRFQQVIKTYLHGVRNRVDTKQTLIRSVEVGGLGIDNEKADKILQTANKYRNEPEQPKAKAPTKIKIAAEVDEPRIVSPAEALAQKEARQAKFGVTGDDYDFSSLLKQTPEQKPKAESGEKQVEAQAQAQELPPLKKEEANYQAKEEEEKKDEKEEFIDLSKIENLKEEKEENIGKAMRSHTEAKNRVDSDINIVQARSFAPEKGKVRMEDVKYIPKLTGPIDELREMSLVNFRRLSANPQEAAQKIKEKIGFLEEESFSKRFEGIKAWRQSPVNKLYLQLGQESIINKKPINDIINVRRRTRKPTLTEHEFKAVMDLNKDLRF